MLRSCHVCKQAKPQSDFCVDRASKDGLSHRCKTCACAQQKRWYRANLQRCKDYNKAWRRAHRNYFKAWNRAFRLAHPGYMSAWEIAHPRHREDWASRNPERQKDIRLTCTTNRRIREKRLFLERVSRRKVYERDAGRCHICGKKAPKTWHLDHLIPLAAGGEHSYKNVAVSCPKCNRKKHTKRCAQLRLL